MKFIAVFIHGSLGPKLQQAIKQRLLASPLFHDLVRASQQKSMDLLSKSSSILKKIQDSNKFPPK